MKDLLTYMFSTAFFITGIPFQKNSIELNPVHEIESASFMPQHAQDANCMMRIKDTSKYSV